MTGPTTDEGRHNWWLSIDEIAIAFGVGRKRAYQLAKSEKWRTAPGTRPRQYLFTDIRRTFQHRQEQPMTPAPDLTPAQTAKVERFGLDKPLTVIERATELCTKANGNLDNLTPAELDELRELRATIEAALRPAMVAVSAAVTAFADACAEFVAVAANVLGYFNDDTETNPAAETTTR